MNMTDTRLPARAPGLAVQVIEPPSEVVPVRSDVAGFLGRTRRGPVRTLTRVDGLKGYRAIFGDLAAGAVTTYAIQGYFVNDGEVAHVLRLAGPRAAKAQAIWDFSNPTTRGPLTAGSGFLSSRYVVEASSPGSWAENAKVTFRYREQGVTGTPAVDVMVQADAEPVEYLRGISPSTFEDQVNALSALIRVTRIPEAPLPAGDGIAGLQTTLTLRGGVDDPPTQQDYLDGLTLLNDEPEVALIALPDLYTDIDQDDDRLEILATAIQLAEASRDRLVLVDIPPQMTTPPEIRCWLKALRDLVDFGRVPDGSKSKTPADCPLDSATDYKTSRAGAVYHPWLCAADPLGTTTADMQILLPPSGHVAGVISRLDRQRGAYYTPANAPVLEVFDVAQTFRESDRAVLNDAGVNLIRCFPNQGLLVWGGRTLGTGVGNLFVAHRRLVHRLVRAIRNVTEPLVFDTNGPELWLALVRAITTVLLEAFRGGGLKGSRSEEAFFVQCDAQNNSQENIDLGQVVCDIGIAPATPMEFILLRVALSADGRLEVFE
jgi:hypothetical protein